jgi:hypothetical protein
LLVRFQPIKELLFLKERRQRYGSVLPQNERYFHNFLKLFFPLENHVSNNLKNGTIFGLDDVILPANNYPNHNKEK